MVLSASRCGRMKPTLLLAFLALGGTLGHED